MVSRSVWLAMLVGCSSTTEAGPEPSDATGAEDTGSSDTTSHSGSDADLSTDDGSEGGSGDTLTAGTSGGQGTTGAETGGDPGAACHVDLPGPPPADVVAGLGLDPFYEKFIDADGLAVVSSAKVRDEALQVACEITVHMLLLRPDVRDAMIANRVRIGIMAQSEVTTDMPEHADLYDAFPGTDWDNRARGLGATKQRPLSSVGEENLVHLTGDPYDGESIMVHEFAHSIWITGVVDLADGSTKDAELGATFDAAIAAGSWANTYAGTNQQEYWAEGVQSWFDSNLEAEPANGIHNHVDTRAELREYDPTLAALVAEFFPEDDWVVP